MEIAKTNTHHFLQIFILFLRSSIALWLFAAYLLGMQICLRGHVRASSWGHGGTTAAPGQHRAHRCQPLHAGEARGLHSALPQKKCPEEDKRVRRSLEVNGERRVERRASAVFFRVLFASGLLPRMLQTGWCEGCDWSAATSHSSFSLPDGPTNSHTRIHTHPHTHTDKLWHRSNRQTRTF